jgi:predicted GIY-YIG superfamily endonuclease
MMRERRYWLYMASRSGTFYIGVTDNQQRHVSQRKRHGFDGFSAQYTIDRLVYLQGCHHLNNASRREK